MVAVAEFRRGRLKSRLNPATLDRINRWTGVLIAAFGFLLLMESFRLIIAWSAPR